jgi:hypothetical protein
MELILSEPNVKKTVSFSHKSARQSKNWALMIIRLSSVQEKINHKNDYEFLISGHTSAIGQGF